MPSSSDDSAERKHREILSFGRRRGRKLRPAREKLVDRVLPGVSVPMPKGEGQLELAKIFGHDFPSYWLEIGFGSGEHLVHQAELHPDAAIIGCEPYVNGYGSLLADIDEKQLENVRLHPDDARPLVARLPDASLERVFILFPDPWPKSRHHKRRLVQQPFLAELARVMKLGALLQLATDHDDYLTWMLEHLLASPYFEWTAREKADWQKEPEDWVKTRYQQKAELEGRGATFLRFERNAVEAQ